MPSPSRIRHRRFSNAATIFPSPIEPGELAVNTAARQLSAGDADPASVGVPLQLLAVRIFDVRGIYAVGDYVITAGQLYRCKAPHGPAVFNAAHFEMLVGVDTAADALDNYLLLTGGTLSGPLFLPIVAPSLDSEATNKKYVDNEIANVVLGNVVAGTIINMPAGNISSTTVQAALNELDAEKVAKAGDTMTGPLVLPADPTLNLQAATKQYVDARDALNAPLASPIFTGDARAVTPSQGDADTSIATTAFVATALAALTIDTSTIVLADAPTIIVPGGAANGIGRNFRLNSMAADRALGYLQNPVVGTSGVFFIKQDGVGNHKLTGLTSNGYVCDGDVAFAIGVTPNKWSIFSYQVFDATHTLLQLIAVNSSLG